MLRNFLLRSLLSLWRLSTLYSLILLTLAYCQVLDVSFSEIDEGSNRHKFNIAGLYVAYLLFWLWMNLKLTRSLTGNANNWG